MSSSFSIKFKLESLEGPLRTLMLQVWVLEHWRKRYDVWEVGKKRGKGGRCFLCCDRNLPNCWGTTGFSPLDAMCEMCKNLCL